MPKNNQKWLKTTPKWPKTILKVKMWRGVLAGAGGSGGKPIFGVFGIVLGHFGIVLGYF